MSKISKRPIPCPSCGHTGEFTFWDSVNVDLDPEMREKVLRGELFRWTCPNCGETFPAPNLHIYYPDVAKNSPVLVFSNLLKDGSGGDDFDNQEVVRPEEWYAKNEVEEGYPMYAQYGTEVVQKMLKYDLLYLMFVSEATAAGDPEEMEISRLDLTEFNNKWWEVNKNLINH